MIKLKKYLACAFIVIGCTGLINGQTIYADTQSVSSNQEAKSNLLETIIPSEKVASSETLDNGIKINYMDDDTIRIFAPEGQHYATIKIKLSKNQGNSYMQAYYKYYNDFLISTPNVPILGDEIQFNLVGDEEYILTKMPIKGGKGLFERKLDDGRIQLVDGDIVRGWYKNYVYWSYSNDEGIIQTGWHTIKNKTYYFAEDGRMQTEWLNLNGKSYYLSTEQDGSMRIGWYKINGIWYYFNDDGSMKTGWLNYKGSWYYFYGNGQLATGFINLGGDAYYYLDESDTQSIGIMKTGWQHINGKWYYFNTSNDSGLTGMMNKGWHSIGGTWYYFNYSDGTMAHDTWIGGYYVNSNGAF